MNEEVTTEAPKLSGIAAYHQKKRLEKEQKSGINKEFKELKSQIAAVEEGEELEFGIDISKTYVFETIEKSRNPRHQILSSTSRIFDHSQGRMREVKYIPIADTIFVDEMGDRYDGYPDQVLGFHNNQLTVPGVDVRLVEFMLSHDEYEGNKNRISKKPPLFTLVNKHDLEKKKEATYEAKLKALNIINDQELDELLPISRVIFNIMETDSITVKNRLREWADKYPEKIINNIDSPHTKRAYIVQAALDQGIIEVDVKNHSVMWSETKMFITEIRAVNDLKAQLSEITDFTFTTTGSKVYDVLKAKINL